MFKHLLTFDRRILETLLIVTISLVEIIYSSKKIKQNNEAEDKSLPVLEKNCSPNTIKLVTYCLFLIFLNKNKIYFLTNLSK